MAASAGFSVRTLTDDLMSSVSEVVAGDEDIAKCLKQDAAFFGCKIDRNLQVMQAAMSFVGQLDTADDPMLEEKKTRASYFVGIGTGV
jgi:type IV secretion system protein VirB6